MMAENLEAPYVEAKSALKRKEYDRAAELLTQIIAVDENYKDVSRLLAQTVRLKRRRWYSHPALWIMIIVVTVIGLGMWILPRLPSQPVQEETSSSVVLPTASPTATITPAQTSTPTITPSPMPTAIPLMWKRISLGQDFQRDSVMAFATDRNDPDVIYAGMKNSGVYKTIDGGNSWFPSHHGLESTQVLSLEIDSQNSQILYAGTMGGVFKTEDGGENWRRVSDGIYLLMDWQDNSHLYARDDGGIYETKDQGNTWTINYTLKKNCPDEIASWAIHPKDGNMLFIGGGEKCAGVYQSADSGNSWASLGLEDRPNIDTIGIAVNEQGIFSLYTYFDYPITPNWGTRVLRDEKADWSFTQNIVCNILAFDPTHPITLYCHDYSSLYVMQAHSSGWKLVPGSQSKFYSAFHIDRPGGSPRIIASGADVSNQKPLVGIYILESNAALWVMRNGGMGAARMELKIDPLDDAKIYLGAYYAENQMSTSCALYRAQDSGKNWSLLKVELGWCGPSFDLANALYLNENGKLQKSWDGGDSWLWDHRDLDTNSNTGKSTNRSLVYALPNFFRDGYYYEGSQSVSANPYVSGLVYDAGNAIWYSTIGGGAWQQSVGSEGSWDARLFYTDQSKMIFAIGRYQQKYSTDNGKTWQPCGTNVTTSRSDTRLALDLQGERLYLATPGQGVLISMDKCNSWTPSNNGLKNLYVNTLALDPKDINTVYAGTDGGAYISYDAGQTWGQVNDGLLGATVVYSIAVDKDDKVYAATPYGIFTLEKK